MTSYLFDKNISGKCVRPNVESYAIVYANLPTPDNDNAAYLLGDVEMLTGWAAVLDNEPNTQYLLTTEGQWIAFRLINTIYNWAYCPTPSNYRTPAQRDAQDIVNKIIENNKIVYKNLLICDRYRSRLSAAQQNTLNQLQARLIQRNNDLQDNDQMLTGLHSSQLGSITVILIVSAVVVASLSAAAYFYYKAQLTESEQDVKFSEDLTKALAEKLNKKRVNDAEAVLQKDSTVMKNL